MFMGSLSKMLSVILKLKSVTLKCMLKFAAVVGWICYVQAESGCSGSESSLSSRRTNHWIFVLRDLYQSASSVNESETIQAECPSLLDRVSMHFYCHITNFTMLSWMIRPSHTTFMRIDCPTVDITPVPYKSLNRSSWLALLVRAYYCELMATCHQWHSWPRESHGPNHPTSHNLCDLWSFHKSDEKVLWCGSCLQVYCLICLLY